MVAIVVFHFIWGALLMCKINAPVHYTSVRGQKPSYIINWEFPDDFYLRMPMGFLSKIYLMP